MEDGWHVLGEVYVDYLPGGSHSRCDSDSLERGYSVGGEVPPLQQPDGSAILSLPAQAPLAVVMHERVWGLLEWLDLAPRSSELILYSEPDLVVLPVRAEAPKRSRRSLRLVDMVSVGRCTYFGSEVGKLAMSTEDLGTSLDCPTSA